MRNLELSAKGVKICLAAANIYGEEEISYKRKEGGWGPSPERENAARLQRLGI